MVATGAGGNNAESRHYEAVEPGTVESALAHCFRVLENSDLYYGHGTDNPWDESVQLVLFTLGLPLDSGDEVLAEGVTADAAARISERLRRRVEERVPLAYLLGRAWFAGLEFHCDARALVPRSPLAELVRNDYAPWWTGPPPRRILDLCCGGGSIGIAAARYQPQARVTLADIDQDALALAAENIALHEVGARVGLHRADLFAGLPEGAFELILCNPPYVDAADMAALPGEYRAEPELALAAGEDGLDLALRILAEAPQWLADGGVLMLEVGNSWEALDALCPAIALTWLEFSAGGHGVLCIGRSELVPAQPHFHALAAMRAPERV